MNVNWKSKKVWAALIAAGLIAAQGVGVVVQEQVDAIQVAVNSILAAMVLLGILTDPAA